MVIWIIFSLMTFAVVIAVLWPLTRPETALQQADDSDIAFYKEQTSEIDRDLARGLLSPEEAEAAKAEAGRRLLRTVRHDTSVTYAEYNSKPASSRRKAVSVIAVVLIPLLGLAFYWVHGVPDYLVRSDPDVIRAQQEQEIVTAVAQMEKHLKENPQDGRAWELIAPVLMRMNRTDDAIKAYEKAIELQGEDVARLTGYGEALVFSGNGMVFDKAREVFERAVALKPDTLKARFYLGLSAEQNGDLPKAREIYRAIMEIQSPWQPVVAERLKALDSAGTQGENNEIGPEAINAMIDALAARIAQDGGKPEEWAQLVRSYSVTGQREKALEALVNARKALADNSEGLASFETVIRNLKLDEGGK